MTNGSDAVSRRTRSGADKTPSNAQKRPATAAAASPSPKRVTRARSQPARASKSESPSRATSTRSSTRTPTNTSTRAPTRSSTRTPTRSSTRTPTNPTSQATRRSTRTSAADATTKAVAPTQRGRKTPASASQKTSNARTTRTRTPRSSAGAESRKVSTGRAPTRKKRGPAKKNVKDEDSSDDEAVSSEPEDDLAKEPKQQQEPAEESLEDLQEQKEQLQHQVEVLGLMPPGRAPKAPVEPEMGKSHWDYLLKEMAWMANDFRTERKWKEQSSRKAARDAVRGLRQRANKEKQRQKENHLRLRRLAMSLSKDVKRFWDKIDKIVSFRHSCEVRESKQKQMDKQLDFLLGQTERYSQMLAQKLSKSHDQEESAPQSQKVSPSRAAPLSLKIENQRPQTNDVVPTGKQRQRAAAVMVNGNGRNDDYDDDDYSVEESLDDETTLAEQELTEKPSDTQDEMAALKAEAEMSREELLAMYGYGSDPAGPSTGDTPMDRSSDETSLQPSSTSLLHEFTRVADENTDHTDADWEDDAELDDETTLQEQELQESPQQIDDELQDLKAEAEMSREELLAKYYPGLSAENGDGKNVTGGASSHSQIQPVFDASTPVKGESVDDDWQDDLEEDDETTLVEQERGESKESVDEEVNALHAEAEMSREELLAQYGISEGYNAEEAARQSEEEDEDEDEDVDEEATAGTENTQQSGERTSELLGQRRSSQQDEGNDDDYESAMEEDDETTLAAQDARESAADHQSELNDLHREAEMTREELMKKYGYPVQEEEQTRPVQAKEQSRAGQQECPSPTTLINLVDSEPPVEDTNEDDDMDFEADCGLEEDDETTLEEQERLEGTHSSEEMEALQREAMMSREELLKLYGYGDAGSSPHDEQASEDVSGDENPEDNKLVATQKQAPQMTVLNSFTGLVRVPFLLTKQLKLREYQHIGLDWLVSLYERRLNGILADEMGLGKTLQTISLLAHLAGSRGVWGPHLIVVPTSVLLNWEMEIKRWCPGFKVITYYGTAKQRKQKRVGWSKPNAFHICITSYQLAVQDAQVFKRRKWVYLILDEAHNIKNFRSQRWQTLLNFNTQRRLLLTGTPLQNSLMELWSLMHFLMPHVFRSQSEFKYWFSNPLNSMVENATPTLAALTAPSGDQEQAAPANPVVQRLHTVIRPFLLRRLKSEVAKQLPKKYEHIVPVHLSRRQQYLYEDFISRSSTRDTISRGGYLGMMSVLMKLRMVCNHPDIFEPRVVSSSFILEPKDVVTAVLAMRATDKSVFEQVSLASDPTSLVSGGVGAAHLGESRGVGGILVKIQPGNSKLIEVLCSSSDGHAGSASPRTHETSSGPIRARMDERRRELGNRHIQLRQERATRTATANAKRFEPWMVEPCFGEDTRRVVTVASPFEQTWETTREVARPNMLVPVSTRYLRQTSPTETLRGMVKNMEERVGSLKAVINKFVFLTPKVRLPRARLIHYGGGRNVSRDAKWDALQRDFDRATSRDGAHSLSVYHPIAIRRELNFPDRMLVQYDCGKLQVLARMLHDLKRGGHRVLIFTQMTKMLNVLEVFLNLHGHVYFRLDGSTNVEQRQRMMEQFNRDEKIFAFILSTRSGGLGINLVGADTVIFYDSDWNPSMDAQAQDRAHRIGQTRDVHIYRLVTQHTIEENILRKANQKRHLNKLTVEDGSFKVDSLFSSANQVKSLLFGGGDNDNNDDEVDESDTAQSEEPIRDAGEITRAMAEAEDESDKQAAARATKEARDENVEFDESVELVDPDGKGGASAKGNATTTDVALTAEQYVQLESQLQPVERFAISFRTHLQPPRAIVKSMIRAREEEAARQLADATEGDAGEAEEKQHEEWSLEDLEAQKKQMEDEGQEELITVSLKKQGKQAAPLVYDEAMFTEIRRKVARDRLLRRITGDAWVLEKEDGPSKRMFYRNVDTHETTLETPSLVAFKRVLEDAREKRWNAVPRNVLLHVLQFVDPSRDRRAFGQSCRKWYVASCDEVLHHWVDSNELGTTASEDGFKDLLTVGTAVEFLDTSKAWVPAVVLRVTFEGLYAVICQDHTLETNVPRENLRRDSGGRYTMLRPPDGKAAYGVFNEHFKGQFGCGVPPPAPRRHRTLQAALASARPGETIVLRVGTHHMPSAATSLRDVEIVGEDQLVQRGGPFVRGALGDDEYSAAVNRKEVRTLLEQHALGKGQVQAVVDQLGVVPLPRSALNTITQRSVVVLHGPMFVFGEGRMAVNGVAMLSSKHMGLMGQGVGPLHDGRKLLHALDPVTHVSLNLPRVMGSLNVLAGSGMVVRNCTALGTKRGRMSVWCVGQGASLYMDNSTAGCAGTFGIGFAAGSHGYLSNSKVIQNQGSGVLALGGMFHLDGVKLSGNRGCGVQMVFGMKHYSIQRCDMKKNKAGELSDSWCSYGLPVIKTDLGAPTMMMANLLNRARLSLDVVDCVNDMLGTLEATESLTNVEHVVGWSKRKDGAWMARRRRKPLDSVIGHLRSQGGSGVQTPVARRSANRKSAGRGNSAKEDKLAVKEERTPGRKRAAVKARTTTPTARKRVKVASESSPSVKRGQGQRSSVAARKAPGLDAQTTEVKVVRNPRKPPMKREQPRATGRPTRSTRSTRQQR